VHPHQQLAYITPNAVTIARAYHQEYVLCRAGQELINSLASRRRISADKVSVATASVCDPTDDMVLGTAVNSRADLLVTFNQEDLAAAAKGFAVN
jgi:predicted nucleic acid-binding protein